MAPTARTGPPVAEGGHRSAPLQGDPLSDILPGAVRNVVANPLGVPLAVQGCDQAVRQRREILRIIEQKAGERRHHSADITDCCCHHRAAARHRFQDDVGAALVVAGEHERIRRAEPQRDLVGRFRTRKQDTVGNPQPLRKGTEFVAVVPLRAWTADDRQPYVGAGLQDPRQRADDAMKALARRQMANRHQQSAVTRQPQSAAGVSAVE